uniref:hypothetical protein n=1 Tax=Thaumasiovibrio occultus TaxID=1891184 RepID=UPI000B363C3A|nr:hypothetical protein [Thaumasiovibrio occultus]
MKLSRRGWNNVLMIGSLLCIAAVQLPELIKQRLGVEAQSVTTELLPFAATIERIAMPEMVLSQQQGEWQTDRPIPIDASVLAARWGELSGTLVSGEVIEQLRPQMISPLTVEVSIAEREEPYRITAYSLPSFWLMQNWQSQWIAITVDGHYLFPNL